MFAFRNRQSPTTNMMIRINRSPVTIHLHDDTGAGRAVGRVAWSGLARSGGAPPLTGAARTLAMVGVVAGTLYAVARLARAPRPGRPAPVTADRPGPT